MDKTKRRSNRLNVADSAQKSPNGLDKARQARQSKIDVRRGQVSMLLSRGQTAGQIAEQLNVSKKTIERDMAALTNGHAK